MFAMLLTLRANLLEKPLRLLGFMLLVMAASGVLSLVVQMRVNGTMAWDTLLKRTWSEVLVVTSENRANLSTIGKIYEGRYKMGPIGVSDVEAIHGGQRLPMRAFHRISVTEMNEPLIFEGTRPSSGEVLLDLHWARDHGLEVGDSLTLVQNDIRHQLTVAGLCLYADRPYPQWGRGTLYLSDKELFEIDRFLMATEVEAEELADFIAKARARVNDPSLRFYDWRETRLGVIFFNSVSFGVLGLAGLLVALVAALVIVGATGVLVHQRLTRFGLLKAIGFTPSNLVILTVLEHLLPAIPALGLGWWLGTLLAPDLMVPRYLQVVYELLEVNKGPSVLNLLAFEILLLLVALAAFLPARWAARLDTRESLLRRAAWGQPGMGLLPATRWLSLSWVLALRNLTQTRGRTLLIMASVVLAMATASFGVILQDTFRSYDENMGLLGRPYDMLLVRGAQSDKEVRQLLDKHGLHYYSGTRLRRTLVDWPMEVQLELTEQASAELGFRPVTGRLPSRPGSVAISAALATQTGLMVGDEIGIHDGENQLRLQISGTFFTTDHSGRVILCDQETWQSAGGKHLETYFYMIKLPENIDREATASNLRTELADDIFLEEVVLEGEARDLVTTLLGLVLVLALITWLNVLFTSLLDIGDWEGELATFKALGLTPFEIGRVILLTLTLRLLPGLLLGLFAGLLISWQLAAELGRMSGISQPPLIYDPFHLGALLILALVTGLLSGWPAIRRARRLPVTRILSQEM